MKRVGLLFRALDSIPVDPGSNLSSVIYGPIRNILGQDDYSHVLMSTRHFIPPGSINWYQPRLGVNVLCAAAGTACGYMLAAVSGCDGANPS